MDLRHLQSFVAVAEELSFQRAAKRLHLSQPPLSRRIKNLEKEVGVRLLNRSRNSQVSLTDAGHAFLTGARQTLASAEEALRHARETIPGVQGRLNLANIAALSTHTLPPLLQAFHAEYPQVEVFLQEMERAEQTAALREGRIHVGLFPDLGTTLDRHFQFQPMFSCPMVAVLPAKHVLTKDNDAALRIEALAGAAKFPDGGQAHGGLSGRSLHESHKGSPFCLSTRPAAVAPFALSPDIYSCPAWLYLHGLWNVRTAVALFERRNGAPKPII